jgi:hypothetical protein
METLLGPSAVSCGFPVTTVFAVREEDAAGAIIRVGGLRAIFVEVV